MVYLNRSNSFCVLQINKKGVITAKEFIIGILEGEEYRDGVKGAIIPGLRKIRMRSQ